MNDEKYGKVFMKETLKLIKALRAENIRFTIKMASDIDGAVTPCDIRTDMAITVKRRAVIFDRWGFCSVGGGKLDQVDMPEAVAYLKGN